MRTFHPLPHPNHRKVTFQRVGLFNYHMRLMLLFILNFQAEIMISNKLVQLHLKHHIMTHYTIHVTWYKIATYAAIYLAMQIHHLLIFLFS